MKTKYCPNKNNIQIQIGIGNKYLHCQNKYEIKRKINIALCPKPRAAVEHQLLGSNFMLLFFSLPEVRVAVFAALYL